MRRPSDTALHEAAHAVIAHLLGVRVTELCLTGKIKGAMGYASMVPTRCKVVQVAILQAGQIAECLWRGRPAHNMPSGDLRAMVSKGFSWTGLNIIRADVEKCLRAWKPVVFIVARALERDRKMSGAEFARLMKPVSVRPPAPKIAKLKLYKKPYL